MTNKNKMKKRVSLINERAMSKSTKTKKKQRMWNVSTNDGVLFKVEKDIVLKIPLLKDITEMLGVSNEVIPLPNLDSRLFSDILNLLQATEENAMKMLSSKTFDELTTIVNGANYLAIENLVDSVCDHLIVHLEGMSQEEVNEKLGA